MEDKKYCTLKTKKIPVLLGVVFRVLHIADVQLEVN